MSNLFEDKIYNSDDLSDPLTIYYETTKNKDIDKDIFPTTIRINLEFYVYCVGYATGVVDPVVQKIQIINQVLVEQGNNSLIEFKEVDFLKNTKIIDDQIVDKFIESYSIDYTGNITLNFKSTYVGVNPDNISQVLTWQLFYKTISEYTPYLNFNISYFVWEDNDIDLRNNIIDSHRNDFWLEFLEATSQELNNVKDLVYNNKYFLSVQRDSITEDQCIYLCDMLGFYPNRSLDTEYYYMFQPIGSVLNQLKLEVMTLFHKRKFKGSLSGYYFFTKLRDINTYLYNCVVERNKLIKYLKYGDLFIDGIWNQIDTYIENRLYYKYFDKVIPDVFYEKPSSFINVSLDTLRNGEYEMDLDSQYTWYLDSASSNKSTNHIMLDYIPKVYENDSVDYETAVISLNDEKYLVTKDILNFLGDVVKYNKKTTTIGHVGISLNFTMDESGIFNLYTKNLENDHDKLYTIPSHEIISSITFNYVNRFSGILDKNIYLDKSGGLQLDFPLPQESFIWRLDRSRNPKPLIPENIFQKICAGTGNKNLIDFDHKHLFTIEQNKNLIIHNDFDDFPNQVKFIKELGVVLYYYMDFIVDTYFGFQSDYVIRCMGSTETSILSLFNGIIGRSIWFDGISGFGTLWGDNQHQYFYSSSNNFNVNTWIKKEIKNSDFIYPILNLFINYDNFIYLKLDNDIDGDFFYLDIALDSQTQFIKYYFSDSNLETMVSFRFNGNDNTIDFFVNGQKVETKSFDCTLLQNKNFYLEIGRDYKTLKYFKGMMDEIRIGNEEPIGSPFISDSDYLYLYENKIGGNRYLDRQCYEVSIAYQERKENPISDFYKAWFTFTQIEGNKIKNEFIRTLLINEMDEIPSQYKNIQLNYYPIKKGSLVIPFKSEKGGFNIVDNREGVLLADNDNNFISGKINYDTGFISEINFYILVNNQGNIIPDTSGKYIIDNFVLPNDNIEMISFKLRYKINNNFYITTIDSNGSLSGAFIQSGRLYNDNIVSITLGQGYTFQSDVIAFYQYKEFELPVLNQDIYANYSSDLDITEIGVKDDTDILAIYNKIPKCDLNDYNHISTNFVIMKEIKTI